MHYCWSLQFGQEQNWFGAPTWRTGSQHSPRALQASPYSPLCACLLHKWDCQSSRLSSQYLPCWILLRRKWLIVSINQGEHGCSNWRQAFLNSVILFWLLFQNSWHKHWQHKDVYFFVNTKLLCHQTLSQHCILQGDINITIKSLNWVECLYRER